jgi:hypothetical protein
MDLPVLPADMGQGERGQAPTDKDILSAKIADLQNRDQPMDAKISDLAFGEKQ